MQVLVPVSHPSVHSGVSCQPALLASHINYCSRLCWEGAELVRGAFLLSVLVVLDENSPESSFSSETDSTLYVLVLLFYLQFLYFLKDSLYWAKLSTSPLLPRLPNLEDISAFGFLKRVLCVDGSVKLRDHLSSASQEQDCAATPSQRTL